MKLIIGISQDGFVAKHDSDRMDWLGETDKAVFRMLTGVGGICGAGMPTIDAMPEKLHGRVLIALSRSGCSLQHFYFTHPDAWLLGGQTMALEAFRLGYLDEVFICQSMIAIGGGIQQKIRPYLSVEPDMKTRINNVSVEVYRKNRIRKTWD